MSAFFFALVASFVLSAGARDQLLVAHLRTKLGPSTGLLATALACAALTGALAGWAGGRFAEMLSINASQMFVALALLLSAAELAWPVCGRLPEEPTRSLGAAALTLILRQATDAARFVVFALGAALALPHMAAAGGAIGGMAAMATGYALGPRLAKLPLRGLRLGLAFMLAVMAVTIGLSVRGLIS